MIGIVKDQIDNFGIDPTSPLPEDDEQSNGVIVEEPLCPLGAEGLLAFTEEMTRVSRTDAWDISPYLHSLDILRRLKQQYTV